MLTDEQRRELAEAMGFSSKKPAPPIEAKNNRKPPMTTPDIITRLKAHPGVTDDTVIGVISSFGKDAEIDIRDTTKDIVATLTTTDIDLENEVLEAKGADLGYLRENGVVFADHNYGLSDYVGDIRAVTPVYGADKQTPKGWKMRFHVCDTLEGETVQKIVDHRGKIGISIGFIAEDFGPPTAEEVKLYTQNGREPTSIVRKFRGFEGSATLLPCNVKCQAAGAPGGKAIFKTGPVQDELLHDVDDLVRLGIITREAASRLGAPITPKRKFHAVSEGRKKLVFGDGGLVFKVRARVYETVACPSLTV